VKISCPACAAKYSIADEKVQDRLAKIRCRKCGTTIVIDGKVQPVNIYAADGSMPAHSDPSAEGSAGEYSVDLGDNDQRTMSLHDLIDAYNAGTVTAETYLWTEGMADWKPLSEFPEVVDALHQAASHPAVPAAPAAAPSPWDGGAAAKAAAASPARAASRDSRRAGSADLFGSLDTAGSESDSFGAGQDAPVPVATGARNESSVLFSLSALTSAAAKPAAPSPSKPTASATSSATSSSSSSGGSSMKEDSGLIDLKALTAAAKPEAEAPMIAPAPLGLGAPLGFSPPLGSGVSAQIEAPLMPPPKNRTGLYIGAGIAIAVIGAALILRPSEAPPEQTQPTVAAPAPTPTPTPTPTEAMLAKPPATGTAEEGADGGKPKVAAARRRGARSTGSKSSTTAGGDKAGGESAAAAPAPKKSGGGGGCGCAADDLMCNMRCSSGKK